MQISDIPKGTNVQRIGSGGEAALAEVMSLYSDMEVNGYIKIKIDTINETVTSFIVLKDSEPVLGIREVIATVSETSGKRIRRVYAGLSTLEDVKEDAKDPNAALELHTGVDIETIIDNFGQDQEPEKKKEDTRKVVSYQGPKRIGLFWGSGGDEESVEREFYREKMANWEREGYDVLGLEAVMDRDLKEVKETFEKYEEGLVVLENMAAELDLLSLAGFEKEVSNLKTMMNNPSLIPQIKTVMEELESKSNQRIFDTKGDICLVCGQPLKSEARCPRCGAATGTKPEEADVEGPGVADEETEIEAEPDIQLEDSRCYLIEEDRPTKSLDLFNHLLKRGYRGYLLTRTNPRLLGSLGEKENAQVVWLTDRESATQTTIPPVLERIMYEISGFLREEEQACLIMDGIEYLVSNNSFDAVLRFIRTLVDEISVGKSVLLVTIGPYTLKEQELKILERELEKIPLD